MGHMLVARAHSLACSHTQIYKTQTQFKDGPAGERRADSSVHARTCRRVMPWAQVWDSSVENEDISCSWQPLMTACSPGCSRALLRGNQIRWKNIQPKYGDAKTRWPIRTKLHRHYNIINWVLDQIKWKSSDYTCIYKKLHCISACSKTTINV